MSEWTSVDLVDQLPPIGKRVLVFTEKGFVEFGGNYDSFFSDVVRMRVLSASEDGVGRPIYWQYCPDDPIGWIREEK